MKRHFSNTIYQIESARSSNLRFIQSHAKSLWNISIFFFLWLFYSFDLFRSPFNNTMVSSVSMISVLVKKILPFLSFFHNFLHCYWILITSHEFSWSVCCIYKKSYWNLNKITVYIWGGGSACRVLPTPWPPEMKINLPRHDLLGEERWPISQRRRAKSLFLNLLLGWICTGIQVKLISHCQAVRIKQ